MRCTFILICLLSIFHAQGQKKKVLAKVEADLIKEQAQWNDGSIQLWGDSSKISGSLLFNDKTQLLAFKLEGGEPENLRPNEAKGFEFFDTENQLMRSFVSMNYPKIESFTKEDKIKFYSSISEEKTILEFFEVVKKTEAFDLLCKTDALHMIEKNKKREIIYDGSLYQKKYVLGQEVTLFFYDLKEKMFPAIRVTKIETKKATKNAKNKYYFFWGVHYTKNPDIDLDEKLLSKIMHSYFPKVKEYIVTSKLDISNIEHLLKIIDHYKQLESQSN